MTKPTIEDLVISYADKILADVDYDIFKEDVENGGEIKSDIEDHLISLLQELRGYSVAELLDL